MTLRSGFKLGDWLAHPLEGRLVCGEREERIQPKAMDVLLRLAENAGAVVSRDELLEDVWDGRAQSDEPLTRCIGDLRRALAVDDGAEYIRTIPKRGYQLLAIVEELTTDNGSRSPVEALAGKRRTTLAAISAGVLFIFAAAATNVDIQKYFEEDLVMSVDAGRSIAVLPFVNMSAEKKEEYFSDGVSEEVMNLLARVPQLRVISRTSAFSYKGKDVDLPTIAKQLNVEHILEGSVRKDGNQVRIAVQLIDARSDTHLWSETYDRTLDNIFATQDEIAATVVEQLKMSLSGYAPAVQAADPEAYILTLQARFLLRQFTADTLALSIELADQALAIDSTYAAAWEVLASGYLFHATQGLQPFEESYEQARKAAIRALELNPAFAPANRILAQVAMDYDRDLVAAARHYERSLSLEPFNTETVFGAADLAVSLGRFDQSIAMGEYAIALDPVSPFGYANLGLHYRLAGRLDQAIGAFRTTLTLSPEYVGAHYLIGEALLLKGDFDSALANMQMEEQEARRIHGVAMVYHAIGQAQASDEALAMMVDKYEQEWAYNIAYVLSFRGEADRAFEWLSKAATNKDPGLGYVVIDALFSNIRNDPRWLPFLESIGKSPEQLAAIEFNVMLPQGADP